MKNTILIFGLVLLSLCVLSVYAESAISDENLTEMSYEDMVTLPNGTTINVVVFMPITVIMDSSDDHHPLHVIDRMNLSDVNPMLMGNGTSPVDMFGDGFYKPHAGKNLTPALNGTGIKHTLNGTASKVSENQSAAKPNLTITW